MDERPKANDEQVSALIQIKRTRNVRDGSKAAFALCALTYGRFGPQPDFAVEPDTYFDLVHVRVATINPGIC
ncbi:hypothetical protein XF30_17295 [Bradyrhizobium sp. SUTN9-2]|nr:hypothetical protein XF30_17295 [Bradyrhizobium sp. SUTN9-2]